jgi:ferric-dicitrate binding protein FerR (iron transport regulator)
MMNKKNPEEYQIEDFLMDESFVNYHSRLDTDHHAFWEEWIIQHPAKRSLVNEAREMLQMLSLTPLENEHQEEITRIKRAIHDEQLPTVKKRPGLFRLLNWNKVNNGYKKKKSIKYLLAAAVLIFLISGYLLSQYFNVKSNSLTERHNNGSTPLVFTLNVGTIVTLAAHSFLRYPYSFGSKDREVYLDGEAQFHVSRDVNHPFKVHAEDITATVLGTVFNIKKQQGDSIVFVELLEGKLKIEIKNIPGSPIQPLILNPNERVVYNQYSKNLYKESWQRYNEQPSQKNHLVFRQNNFEEIAKQIKSVFGVILINQSNKKNWRFTGKFNNTAAKEIIESICLVKGLNSQATGDTIFIK